MVVVDAVLVAVVLVLGLAYVRWLVRLVQRSRHAQAPWVVRHLQRHGTYMVKAGPFTNAWTPERPASARRLPMGFYQMPGRGLLTYSLEPDGETVRLVWRSKRGSHKEWVGPVPIVATVDYRGAMRRGRTMAVSLALALGAGGAILGALTGSVLAGLGGGLVAGFFVGSTVLSGKQIQAFRIAHEKQLQEVGGPSNGPGAGQDDDGNGLDQKAAPPSSKQRRAVRVVYLIYGTVLTLGFVIGFSLVGGSGLRRFLFGVLGLLLAVVFMSLVNGLIRLGVALKPPNHHGTGKTH